MKEPRNYQELRVEHSRATPEPTQDQNTQTPDKGSPSEPTRPSLSRSQSGSTDIERFVYKGAEAARNNDAVDQARTEADSTRNTAAAVPTHKLDKESGKALLQADLKEVMGEVTSRKNTPDRSAGQDLPAHNLDKQNDKALLEADPKEAKEGDHPNKPGPDGGRDR